MIEINPENLIGKESGSLEVVSCLELLNTLQRPEIEDDDESFCWIFVRNKGIEIGFIEDHFFHTGENLAKNAKKLFLFQIKFYGKGLGNKEYPYSLPYQLELSDSRDLVRGKLKNHEDSRKSYITDCWAFEDRKIVAKYSDDHSRLEFLIFKLDFFKRKPKVHKGLDWRVFAKLLGLDLNSSTSLDIEARRYIQDRLNEDEESREASFLEDLGLSVHFETDKKQQKFVSFVKFHREKDQRSIGYDGTLPFELSFDDSPDALFEKVPTVPYRKRDGDLTGYALWHFNDFSLNVLYSTVENFIFRISIISPGYLDYSN